MHLVRSEHLLQFEEQFKQEYCPLFIEMKYPAAHYLHCLKENRKYL